MTPPVAALVLAAGESRRMGRAKQLLPLADGTAMAAHAAAVALAAGLSPVIVVVGAGAAAVAATLPAGVEVVVNDAWRGGPGTSVTAGVRHLIARHPAVAGVVVTPADLPKVTAGDLLRIAAAALAAPSGASASRFGGTLGAPAGFARRHFDALLALDPARGAQRLIRSISGVAQVPVEAAADDVDRPEDYERIIFVAAEPPLGNEAL